MRIFKAGKVGLMEKLLRRAFSPPKRVVLDDSSVLVTRDKSTDALRVELHQEFGDVVLQETIWGWNIYVAEIDKEFPVGYLDLFNTNEEERVDGPIFEILVEDPWGPSDQPMVEAKYFPDHVAVILHPDMELVDNPLGSWHLRNVFNWNHWQDGDELDAEVDFT
jgi:hypothetical protein